MHLTGAFVVFQSLSGLFDIFVNEVFVALFTFSS